MELAIGVDARAATEVGAGRGRVVRELLRAFAAREDRHHYLCYAREPWEEPLGERFQWRTIDSRDPLWHWRAARAAGHECDVFLSSNSYLTTWMLTIPGVPIVYDLLTFDPAARPNRRSVVIERVTLGRAVKRSAALVAISHTTAEALAARFPAAAAKVVVAPLGAPRDLVRPGGADERPDPGFVLAVGTLEPRKNLPALVQAYRALDDGLQRRHPLVVAGELGWGTDQTLASLQSLGQRVRIMGRVSDPELAALYRRCAVFCYPSLGEGFGLPVLEAMAAGAPVVTSNRSSLPEVGGSAVEYADPTNVESITAALARVLSSPDRRAELSAAGRRRAAEFTWARTAEIVVRALEGAAAEGSADPSRVEAEG